MARKPIQISVDLVEMSKSRGGRLAKLSNSDRKKALARYKKFLEFHRKHPKAKLIPTKMIDEMWHLHMLAPKAYAKDCLANFGEILDHGPVPKADEKAAIKKTQELWKGAFGNTADLVDAPTKGLSGYSNCWG